MDKVNIAFDVESSTAKFSPSLYANPRERDRAIFRAGAEYQRNLDAAEGTWAWALEQMKAGKQVTRKSQPHDAPMRINRATGLLARPDSERPFADKAAWFFDDDFTATDWGVVLATEEKTGEKA